MDNNVISLTALKDVKTKPVTHWEGSTAKAKKAIASGDVAAVMASLSYKQKLFCEAYVTSLNGAESVIKAGLKARHPSNAAAVMLKRPEIQITIKALQEQRNKFSSVTKDFVLKKIVKTLESAEEDRNHTATLRAAELLARHLGMFVERTEISGPDGEAIKYEKTQEDASDFTRSIASLAKRSGEKKEA